ncbi:tyrosine-type recombinase/integrase [Alkaliphilus sp. B6464]|uniref:tyrosine-type recombinase/integrase n=1 Tax=Alkaliphilus sp. B6464 TaxID=2731219 RepID=UPI001BA7F2C6|nr:tyrosine-type recombinase/integrase [Alkaliphilus sp. B6464]QUH20925.1 tyrosine-type recombinase/integrase [Alkaliphilus sp. B6464]
MTFSINAFPKMLIDLIIQHKEDEQLRREMMGDEWVYKDKDTSEDFVFTQRNGKMVFVGTIPDWFRDFIRKHNLKYITFHGLRHTNATILISKKMNVVSIAHLLGHSSTSTTTDIYGHHIKSVEQQMADEFNEILSSGTESGTQRPNLKVVK